jgi:hypothetical protein
MDDMQSGRNDDVHSSTTDENNASPGSLSEAMRVAALSVTPRVHPYTGKPRGTVKLPSKRITAKMKNFAAMISKGESPREAYRQAYNVTTSREHTISCNASRLMKDERVIALTQSVWDAVKENLIDDVVAGRRFIMRELQGHAANEKVAPAVRLKALELMGRAFSMFTDKVEQRTEEISPERLKEELQSSLALLDNVTPIRRTLDQ